MAEEILAGATETTKPRSGESRRLKDTTDVFWSIAEGADTVRGLCAQLIEEVTDERAVILAVAARDLTAQLGLLADLGLKIHGSTPLHGAEALDWLVPTIGGRHA